MGAEKVVLMLSYPSDEVGNALVSIDRVDEAGINPYSDVLTLERYRELFGFNKHRFTGVDYVAYYSELLSGNMETLIEMCYLGEGACFCPEKLLRYLLSPEQLASMTMLRFRDGQTRYSVKFGWLDQEKEWNIRSDFIRLAKQVEAL